MNSTDIVESMKQIDLLLNDLKSKYNFIDTEKLKDHVTLLKEYVLTHKVEINDYIDKHNY